MFDDMIEKEDTDIVDIEHEQIPQPNGPKPGTIQGQKYTKTHITRASIKGGNYPCTVTDCKYYSKWTIDHPANTSPVAGSGSGNITVDKCWNPMWCMCCENFKGINISRRK